MSDRHWQRPKGTRNKRGEGARATRVYAEPFGGGLASRFLRFRFLRFEFKNIKRRRLVLNEQ